MSKTAASSRATHIAPSTSQSQSAVHPAKINKPEWTVSCQSIQGDRLIVEHNIQPPDAIEHPLSTYHCIALHLSPVSRRVAYIGREKYEGSVTTGDFCLHPSTHSGFYAWETTDESITLLVKPDFLSRTAAQTECLNPDKIELRPIVISRDPQIEYIARSFLAEMQSEGLGGRLYSESLATQFAIHLLRNYCTFPLQLKQYEGGLSSRKLQAAIDYITTHLESSISLNDLARISQINSDYYFSRLFKQSTGISPYQYVIQQRIEKAKQLLKQDNLPLVEIALMCGFSSQSAFSRTFSKLVKTTPRSYRKQL